MADEADRTAEETDRTEATDALMAVSRLVTAVVARTLAEIGDVVTVPQLRVLVMLHHSEPMNLTAIAADLGVNPSNASRTCDKLVSRSLVTREDDPNDRRHLAIRLTDQGRQLVDDLMDRRRSIMRAIVDEMRPADQRRLTRGLSALMAIAESTGQAARPGTSRDSLIPWVR